MRTYINLISKVTTFSLYLGTRFQMQDSSNSSHHTYTYSNIASFITNPILVSLIFATFVGITRHCTGLLAILYQCLSWCKLYFCFQQTGNHLDTFRSVSDYIPAPATCNSGTLAANSSVSNTSQLNTAQSCNTIIQGPSPGQGVLGKVVKFLIPSSSGPSGAVIEV